MQAILFGLVLFTIPLAILYQLIVRPAGCRACS
jgi:type II secretory pathway component PulM